MENEPSGEQKVKKQAAVINYEYWNRYDTFLAGICSVVSVLFF